MPLATPICRRGHPHGWPARRDLAACDARPGRAWPLVRSPIDRPSGCSPVPAAQPCYGKPLHNNAVTYRWRQARKRGGLGHLRLHDLRHFYASGLIAAGCDVVTVQRALGHASANTTLATYSHLWPDADDRTRTAVEHLMAAALQDRADLVRTSADPQPSDLRK